MHIDYKKRKFEMHLFGYNQTQNFYGFIIQTSNKKYWNIPIFTLIKHTKKYEFWKYPLKQISLFKLIKINEKKETAKNENQFSFTYLKFIMKLK